MPIGRNSWLNAQRKAKKKSNMGIPAPSQDPAKESVLKRMPDRSPGVVPTKSTFARMTGYFPPAMPRYNDAAKMGMTPLAQQKPDFPDIDGDGNKTEPMTEAAKSKPLTRPLKGNQKNLNEGLKKEILDAPPLTRHMQFCGGMSKPYKKK